MEAEQGHSAIEASSVGGTKKRLIGPTLLILTLIPLLASTLYLEVENFHFDSFFPRRIPHRWPMAFSRDAFASEDSWRTFQGEITGDFSWFQRKLTPQELEMMRQRITDNDRWNRFYEWVTPLAIVQFASWLVFTIAFASLWSTTPTESRERLMFRVCVAILVVVALLMIWRGYLGPFFNSSIR